MIHRARSGLAALCLAALAAGCASTPPEQDPVQIKLNDLDTRLARIERVLSNQSLLDLANQAEALRGDLRSMHNDVDQLNNSLEAGRKQQRDYYADLDRRLKTLEARGAAGTGAALAGASAAGAAVGAGVAGAAASGDSGPSGVAAGDVSTAVPDDKAAYQAAFAQLKESQYPLATASFQKFLATYPDSQYADNAQYWLGEAYYVDKSFPEAQAAFQKLVDKYPQSRKRPDALLKIGYCEYELKQWDSAKDTLAQVAAKFSDTPAGHLAQQRLDRMASEQH